LQGPNKTPIEVLSALTQGLRFRLAIALTAFAALCFALPPAVLAFGHGEHSIDCLAHADAVDHGMSKTASMAHHGDHSLPAGAHQPGSGCCGLFCMSALPAEFGQSLQQAVAGSRLALPAEPHPLSRAPEQPDRPPISLLVL
jgi:hypothetical protein